jgi:hypothetical protein
MVLLESSTVTDRRVTALWEWDSTRSPQKGEPESNACSRHRSSSPISHQQGRVRPKPKGHSYLSARASAGSFVLIARPGRVWHWQRASFACSLHPFAGQKKKRKNGTLSSRSPVTDQSRRPRSARGEGHDCAVENTLCRPRRRNRSGRRRRQRIAALPVHPSTRAMPFLPSPCPYPCPPMRAGARRLGTAYSEYTDYGNARAPCRSLFAVEFQLQLQRDRGRSRLPCRARLVSTCPGNVPDRPVPQAAPSRIRRIGKQLMLGPDQRLPLPPPAAVSTCSWLH